ncbi:hypothetical protein ACIRL2_28465 [Embleya sp. NPDC127516]
MNVNYSANLLDSSNRSKSTGALKPGSSIAATACSGFSGVRHTSTGRVRSIAQGESRSQDRFASGAKAGSFSRLLRTASAPYSNIRRSYSLVRQRRRHQDQEWVLSREELFDRFTALPAEKFPQTRRHAAELISGTGHERFEFALGLLMNNLRPASG